MKPKHVILALGFLPLVYTAVKGYVDVREAEERLQIERAASRAVGDVPRCSPRAHETDRAYRQCRYERAVERVEAAGASSRRSHTLGEAALAALDAGRVADARRWLRATREALASLDDEDRWGEAPEKAAIVEGRLALLDGDRVTARSRLLRAGRVLTEPTQLSFGPNVTLARDLLAAGDTAAVRAYFDVLDETYPYGAEKVSAWRAALDRGEGPDFGPSLVY